MAMSKIELQQIVDQLRDVQYEHIYEFDSPEDRAISDVITILEDTISNE